MNRMYINLVFNEYGLKIIILSSIVIYSSLI